jgi:hypothetical protein
MPQNGPAADGHHRFGAIFGFFAQACALAAAQNDNFHKCRSVKGGQDSGRSVDFNHERIESTSRDKIGTILERAEGIESCLKMFIIR